MKTIEKFPLDSFAPRIMFVKYTTCGKHSNTIAGHMHHYRHIIASSNVYKCDGKSGVPRPSTHSRFHEKLYCYLDALDAVQEHYFKNDRCNITKFKNSNKQISFHETITAKYLIRLELQVDNDTLETILQILNIAMPNNKNDQKTFMYYETTTQHPIIYRKKHTLTSTIWGINLAHLMSLIYPERTVFKTLYNEKVKFTNNTVIPMTSINVGIIYGFYFLGIRCI